MKVQVDKIAVPPSGGKTILLPQIVHTTFPFFSFSGGGGERGTAFEMF